MSKETINITLDHFKPNAAPGYGWRNNKEKHMKLHFTVEVLDKDDNEIVNKKFRGYGPYPYKHQVEIDYITDELKTFMVEEVRSTMNKALFVRVCKTITKDLMKACDKDKIDYWAGEWNDGYRADLHSKKPIAEIPLKEIDIADYLPKYQKKILKLILKDKTLFKIKTVGERVVRLDAKAGYNWVESGAIKKDEFVEIINQNTNRVFAEAESKFLIEKGLDRGSKLSAMLIDGASFDIKAFGENPNILLDIREEDIAVFAHRLAELPNYPFKEEKNKILTYILSVSSWFSTHKNLLPSKEWEKVVEAVKSGTTVDLKYHGFPIKMNNFEVKRSIEYGNFTKELLSDDSSIADIFADVWVAAFNFVSVLSERIYYPMVYYEFPINKRIVEKAMHVGKLHGAMGQHYENIEKMDLVKEFNAAIPKYEIANTDPETESEKLEFMISMLSLGYWNNDSEYEETGEVETFNKLVEEFKGADKEVITKLHAELIEMMVDTNQFKPFCNLNKDKSGLLSDLYIAIGSISEPFVDLFLLITKRYLESNTVSIAYWEKIIETPGMYCSIKKVIKIKAERIQKKSPSIYEKIQKLTPPEPESYEEFYEGGELKETGVMVCGDKSDVKQYWQNGQLKYDGVNRWHKNGQIKSERTEETDDQNHTQVEYYEDGSTKVLTVVADNISRVTMYGLNGNKTFSKGFDRTKKVNVGEVSIWHENAQLWDVKNYNEEGKLEGQRFTYDDQGKQIYSAQYSNGIASNQNGEEKAFDCDLPYYETPPKIEESIVWVDGENNGIKTKYEYRDNGKMRFKGEFLGDKKNGLCSWYYESGKKESEGTYTDDKVEGLTHWWYEDGSKYVEVNFKDGKRHGSRTFWDKEGNVTFSATYNEGESSDQNGLDPQYNDNNELTHYIEYKDGVVVNEKVEK
jgi:antitoxin component YwqK of YwqJK toxin-antitoxin module